MIQIYFSNYYHVTFLFLFLFTYWSFFLKNNFFFLRKKPFYFEKMTSVNFLKKINFQLLLNFGLVYNLLYIIYWYVSKEQSFNFWWGHCYLNNTNATLIYYLIVLNTFYLFLLFLLKKNLTSINIEYIFALLNINVIIIFLFYTNTLYTLIFSLELISVTIFYKFTVSKFWFNKNQTVVFNLTKLTKLFSKYYINMLFFQYWSAFFSSIFIFFALLNVINLYGTSEWLILNFLVNVDINFLYFSKNEIFFFIFPLFFGIFLKLGLTPFHFYKIETYKGLPLISIFFYTTYYFFVYFIFFLFFFFFFF